MSSWKPQQLSISIKHDASNGVGAQCHGSDVRMQLAVRLLEISLAVFVEMFVKDSYNSLKSIKVTYFEWRRWRCPANSGYQDATTVARVENCFVTARPSD